MLHLATLKHDGMTSIVSVNAYCDRQGNTDPNAKGLPFAWVSFGEFKNGEFLPCYATVIAPVADLSIPL